MPDATWSAPTRGALPLILIRGFGGLHVDDEKKIAYQGFNDGTVYPHKRGENYIYEGLILRFLKSKWQYHDATNVVGYYREKVLDELPGDLPMEVVRLKALAFSQKTQTHVFPSVYGPIITAPRRLDFSLAVTHTHHA